MCSGGCALQDELGFPNLMAFGELGEGNVSGAAAGKSWRRRSSTGSGRLALMAAGLGIPDSNSRLEFLLGLLCLG